MQAHGAVVVCGAETHAPISASLKTYNEDSHASCGLCGERGCVSTASWALQLSRLIFVGLSVTEASLKNGEDAVKTAVTGGAAVTETVCGCYHNPQRGTHAVPRVGRAKAEQQRLQQNRKCR